MKKASSSNEAGFLRSLRQILTNVIPAGRSPRSANTAGDTSGDLAGIDSLLQRLEREIGYRFNDRQLLRRALTHRSYANEQPAPRPLHNEAFEFLGDAILEFLISTWLLELHPTLSEGHLSKMRAYAVSAANLQKHAARLQLGSFLLLNKGEEKTGGRHKTALQVDAYEALIAAIYLDGGIEAVRPLVERMLVPEIEKVVSGEMGSNHKSLLQQWAQRDYGITPTYEVLEEIGPDHSKSFHVSAQIGGRRYSPAWGRNKKEAEQRAASNALVELRSETRGPQGD